MQSEEVGALCAKFKNDMAPDAMDTFAFRLADASEEAYSALSDVKLKNRRTAFLLSVILGGCAADRFYLGDIKGGLFKLILMLLIHAAGSTLAVLISPWIVLVSTAVVSAWWALDVLQVKSKTVAANTALLFDTVYGTYLEPTAFNWKTRGRKRTMECGGVVLSIEGANDCAVAGFILSLLGGLPGLILSIIGYVMAKRNGESGGIAIAGITMSCLWFAIAAVSVAVALATLL